MLSFYQLHTWWKILMIWFCGQLYLFCHPMPCCIPLFSVLQPSEACYLPSKGTFWQPIGKKRCRGNLWKLVKTSATSNDDFPYPLDFSGTKPILVINTLWEQEAIFKEKHSFSFFQQINFTLLLHCFNSKSVIVMLWKDPLLCCGNRVSSTNVQKPKAIQTKHWSLSRVFLPEGCRCLYIPNKTPILCLDSSHSFENLNFLVRTLNFRHLASGSSRCYRFLYTLSESWMGSGCASASPIPPTDVPWPRIIFLLHWSASLAPSPSMSLYRIPRLDLGLLLSYLE